MPIVPRQRNTPGKGGILDTRNRRDALKLARLLCSGDLTAVWVPDEAHEAHVAAARSLLAAWPADRPRRVHEGLIVSGDRFVSSAAESARLIVPAKQAVNAVLEFIE